MSVSEKGKTKKIGVINKKALFLHIPHLFDVKGL